MIFQGEAFTVELSADGIATLHFDLQGESVNKFNRLAVSELTEALAVLETQSQVRGLLITSGKKVFVAGADVVELAERGSVSAAAVQAFMQQNYQNFSRLEDLPFPSVVAINGFALGGGLEYCLAGDCRVISETASIGMPETQLGIIPGWAGTVRLPRLIGIEAAISWIAGGKHHKAEQALEAGLVESIAPPEQLLQVARECLEQCIAGDIDIHQIRQRKTSPIAIDSHQAKEILEDATNQAKKSGGNNPAPSLAVAAIAESFTLDREQANQVEAKYFAQATSSDVGQAMMGNFLSDQQVAKKSRVLAKQAEKPVGQAAVLGAGIMGGGIAYQSALKGTPIVMKDINQEGIDLGLKEAKTLLGKRVARGQMTDETMQQTLDRITATLDYNNFKQVDLVVEAVVENPKVKHAVLSEVEGQVSADAILTSNTSTISISYLAEALKRPENFCGMHFFNPVHAMPLVEVIRGEKTSDEAIARTVAYATAMGKKPIVVNDCPGFLVNRVLFPYFAGFAGLLRDGADFVEVDRVMNQWGWPMGPALLADVIGLDTVVHCESVMAEGFPDRMAKSEPKLMDLLLSADRLGQKNGQGFYDHGKDEQGKPTKTASEVVYGLLGEHAAPRQSFSEQEIIARTMVPMATELALILDEGVVETPAEADLGLLYGLGFPAFRGGVFRWLDAIGLDNFCNMADSYEGLGKLYQPTESMRAMAADNKRYYY